MRLADGSAGPARLPPRPTARSSRTPSPSPTTRALGMTVWKVNGPLVLAKTRVTGIYPNDTWSGPRVTWSREHCRGGSLTVSLSGDAQLLPDGNTVSTPAGAERPRRPQQGGLPPRPAHARSGETCTVGLQRRADRRAERGDPGEHGRPGARRALQRLRLPAVRIAFDVSPLSHPATGVGNYIRGTLAGMVEAAARRARARRVRADEPARPGAHPRGARRSRRRAAHVAAARLARDPHRVEHRRPSGGGAAARPVRRAPLHRLDVPAAAGRRARDDDPRSRPGALPGVDDEANAVDARRASTRTPRRTCDVIFVNSAFTAAETTELLGVEPERIRVAAARRQGACSPRPARPPTLGAPYILTVATLEPRKNLQALADAHRLARRRHPARGRRRRGLGRAAGARRPARAAARLRLRRGARRPLPRRGGRRLPLAVRGLRDADRRGDGVRHARRRVVARVDGRGVRATSRCAPTPTIPLRSRRDRAGDRRARAASSRSGSRTPPGSPGGRPARRCSPGYEAAR